MPVSHIVLRKSAVRRDWKLAENVGNNGRKVLVAEIRPGKEKAIDSPEWKPGPRAGKTPVLETGYGGTEVTTFTEKAGQERHKHRRATEIYTVLEGVLMIAVNDARPIALRAGDEIVILPGTIHEVVRRPGRLLLRVHLIQCHGDSDKYVQLKPGGQWRLWRRGERVYNKYDRRD